MSLITTLYHPITVAFLVIAIGLCIGKIRICGISLDLAAVLIVAVAIGWLLNAVNCISDVERLDSYMKMFSSLGTALFVSTVGISAGYSLNIKSTGKLFSVAVGAFMIGTAFLTMTIISKINTGISHSNLLGVLCGALTTTPGLSAVCERAGVASAEASLGYGSAYLFGVICTVLTVQILTRKEAAMTKKDLSFKDKVSNKAMFGGLLQISSVIVFGRLLGDITIPFINFSLGKSGGILCSGIVIGYLVGRLLKERSISKEQQGIIRNLGLVLFFVGNGIPAGMQIKNNFSVVTIFVGIVLTLLPIMAGLFICKVLLRKSNMDTATIIAGGMTSTPAIGVLSTKTEVLYDKYSFAYAGALLTIIFF